VQTVLTVLMGQLPLGMTPISPSGATTRDRAAVHSTSPSPERAVISVSITSRTPSTPESFSALHSRFFTPSVAFAVKDATRVSLPPTSNGGLTNGAAGFRQEIGADAIGLRPRSS
jgi:hypothetical protein